MCIYQLHDLLYTQTQADYHMSVVGYWVLQWVVTAFY